jgi:hypothetical protein
MSVTLDERRVIGQVTDVVAVVHPTPPRRCQMVWHSGRSSSQLLLLRAGASTACNWFRGTAQVGPRE